jgi:hypothetical protein
VILERYDDDAVRIEFEHSRHSQCETCRSGESQSETGRRPWQSCARSHGLPQPVDRRHCRNGRWEVVESDGLDGLDGLGRLDGLDRLEPGACAIETAPSAAVAETTTMMVGRTFLRS